MLQYFWQNTVIWSHAEQTVHTNLLLYCSKNFRCQTMKVKPYIIWNMSTKHVNYEEDNNKEPMNKPYNIQNTNICCVDPIIDTNNPRIRVVSPRILFAPWVVLPLFPFTPGRFAPIPFCPGSFRPHLLIAL
jgi:hypothetical protein